ncbi:tyrosine-type recombinase/integrase [Terriglobus albidus]|uniref:tyrosine-type recombinase/integrase n=1 Tax=Terriglobus albidus TaxID=1592106 RepID=UPI0021E0CD8B|nr:site-specific integrase [Terriglobus albidus]
MLLETDIAGMRIDEIDADIVSETSFPAGPSNANKAIRTLSVILGRAKKKKYLLAQPDLVKKVENERTGTFNPLEEAALLHHANQPLTDVALVVFDMGFRPGEVMRISLERGDVDMFRKAIFRRRGKVRKSDTWVPMTDRVFEAIAKRLASLPKNAKWLFPSSGKNGRVSQSGHLTTIDKQFNRAKKDANLPEHLVLYSARHTSLTNVMEETGNPKIVQQLGGHHRGTTTMKYIHPDAVAARDAINKINRDRAEVVAEASRHNLRHSTPLVQ